MSELKNIIGLLNVEAALIADPWNPIEIIRSALIDKLKSPLSPLQKSILFL